MTQILSDFTDSIRRYGLYPPDRIVTDGRIHRFRSGPEREQNGFYRLTIVPAHQGGDIGFGLIGCWKRDLNERWCSKEPGTLAQPDREAMKKARAEMKRHDQEAAKAAVDRAKGIWAGAKPSEASHPYLISKGIGPRGVRQHKDALVVPVYRDGSMVSLQFISADGTKRFLTGGQMEGGYASISGGSASRDEIVIAEGYATAVSIFEATGLPAVVAFNAGNLLPVAKAIRAKYPEARLVIAGDNDQWTMIRGKPVNVGVVRARAAAEAVGGSVAVPDFPNDDPRKGTDWNDYLQRFGKDEMAEAFTKVRTAASRTSPEFPQSSDPDLDRGPPGEPGQSGVDSPPDWVTADYGPVNSEGRAVAPKSRLDSPAASPASPTDWRGRLIPGKEVAEGHPYPFEGKSKTNAYLFVRYHERFAGLLSYNEFTDSVMVMRRPPWDEGTEDSTPRPIRDDDFFMLAAHLEYCDISASKETAADAAVRVAKENAINPPREYLGRLKWDGRPRLDNWLTYYLGADEQPAEYLALVGSKWLIGAVSRVFEPGCKFDSVLILEGKQGLGKSMVLRSLATFNGQDFFLDSVGDIRSKDTLMTMQGKLIVEIAELASFRKSENEEIKAFITRQIDEYRPPYGRTVVRRPRYFVLAGSTNELDEGYLTDDTGNRRYWPVKCKSIDAASMSRDAEQLWAEAVHRYRAGERTWLATEEALFSAREQKSRFMEDAWQERIAEIVRGEWTLKIDDVLAKLELKPRDINNMVKKRVKNSLRQIGWHETRRAGEGRVWRRIEGDLLSRAQDD